MTASATAQEPKKSKPGSQHNSGPAVSSKSNADNHGPREMFAVVDAEGNLRRGMHVAAVARIAPGLYEVSFRRDIRCGVYLATIGGHTHEGLPPTGSVGVQGRSINPRAVIVSTTNSLGENVDTGFHLLVICPDGFA
jgi:hypothetical protein